MENVKEVWERLTALEQSSKSAHKRIDNMERLTESVYTLATETKLMREEMIDLKDRVTSNEEKPSKRWDLVVTTIITAVVSGGVGMFISTIIGG